jgi:GGDEF domain-containing protein
VDEFAVLLVDTGPAEAGRLLPRLGEKLVELAGRRGLAVPLQCRVGSVHRDVPPENADELLREAETDMRRGVVVPPG